jgi:hypothetical protein
MAAQRKLQQEIDRCLKRVQEGIDEFDGIWEKVRGVHVSAFRPCSGGLMRSHSDMMCSHPWRAYCALLTVVVSTMYRWVFLPCRIGSGLLMHAFTRRCLCALHALHPMRCLRAC